MDSDWSLQVLLMLLIMLFKYWNTEFKLRFFHLSLWVHSLPFPSPQAVRKQTQLPSSVQLVQTLVSHEANWIRFSKFLWIVSTVTNFFFSSICCWRAQLSTCNWRFSVSPYFNYTKIIPIPSLRSSLSHPRKWTLPWNVSLPLSLHTVIHLLVEED